MHCELNVFSGREHNNLIVTGFKMLEMQGKISLKINKDYTRCVPSPALSEAIIDGKTKVAFGTMDGYEYDFEEMDEYLNSVDFFFKRSFSEEENKRYSEANQKKIYPLSFNYNVSFLLNPIEYKGQLLSNLYRALRKLVKRNDVKYYENRSRKNNGAVLFMCRIWDPEAPEIENEEVRNERIEINKMRIELVRALKEKYGEKFIGGVSDLPIARELCPDIILDDKLTKKKNYIKTMKKACVCVASTGLHKSTGWKFAEYVAAGKAIVSEPLAYEVNGSFSKNKNYLEYKTAEECLEAIENLLNDDKLRTDMEQANLYYYQNYSRPDKQIENALKTVNPDF